MALGANLAGKDTLGSQASICQLFSEEETEERKMKLKISISCFVFLHAIGIHSSPFTICSLLLTLFPQKAFLHQYSDTAYHKQVHISYMLFHCSYNLFHCYTPSATLRVQANLLCFTAKRPPRRNQDTETSTFACD